MTIPTDQKGEMKGDINAYRNPRDMLREATQYLNRVRQTLIEADRFEDILQVRSIGELYRQYGPAGAFELISCPRWSRLGL
jgi:hypothetical protein